MTGYQQILNTAWPSSLDSFEGVPDIFEPRFRPEQRPAWQRVPHEALVWLGAVLPGVALAAMLAFLGMLLSEFVGINLLRFDRDKGGSPISPIMLAIVLGLLIRNSVGVPVAYEQGLRMCIKNVLRVGIVLLGLKLSLGVLGKIGLIGIPIIIVCIVTALLTVTFINRALGLPRRLGTLIAVGTSICGVSAIVATAPVIEAEEDETSYAVACITIFGMIALFTYPFLAHWLFPAGDIGAGLFLGTAIHDTSQVAGAGLMYKQQFASEGVLKIAMAVKLMRNLAMGLLIPLMAVLYHRSSEGSRGSKRVQPKWHQLVPMFVIGFVLMAAVRSLGDIGEGGRAFGLLDLATWNAMLRAADVTAVW
ncbi:MAG: putative sulfate exporter family transporter, partial [Tepidisphaeraceae bacterium]